MFRHNKGQGRITRLARAAAAVLASAALALEGAPAYAQRRQAEPEANPDFQNSMKGKSDGGPVGETVSEPSSAAAPTADAPTGEEKLIESGSVQSVQIGAAPAAKAAAVTGTAPLDTRVTVRVKGAPLATFLD